MILVLYVIVGYLFVAGVVCLAEGTNLQEASLLTQAGAAILLFVVWASLVFIMELVRKVWGD